MFETISRSASIFYEKTLLRMMIALLIFVAANLLLQLYINVDVLRLGRRIEARLRIAFFEKIPRLHDRYFRSRPVSDMAERSHNIHQLRRLPVLGREFIQYLFEVVLTTAGMIWIHPPLAPVIVLAAALAMVIPLAALPALTEQDLRVRTHIGALGRYYLDTLLGLVAVRTHRAERSIRREHENLLAKWVNTKVRFLRLQIAVEGVQIFVVIVGVAWVILDSIARGGNSEGVLLLAYWGDQLAIPGAASLARRPQICAQPQHYPPSPRTFGRSRGKHRGDTKPRRGIKPSTYHTTGRPEHPHGRGRRASRRAHDSERDQPAHRSW